MPLTDGFSHVASVTDDVDRLVGFYHRVFDAPLLFDMEEEGIRHAAVDVGAGVVLHAFRVPWAVGDDRREMSTSVLSTASPTSTLTVCTSRSTCSRRAGGRRAIRCSPGRSGRSWIWSRRPDRIGGMSDTLSLRSRRRAAAAFKECRDPKYQGRRDG